MLRLRATVSMGRARPQVFDLEGTTISIGRAADATLVLPMGWVGERHVLITEDPSGSRLVRPATELQAVTLGGSPVPVTGRLVPDGETFELVIPSPAGLGDGVRVEIAPALPAGAAGEKSLLRRLRAELIAGAIVLGGAILVAGYLAAGTSRPAGPDRANAENTEDRAASDTPAPAGQDARRSEAQRHIDDAALAFTAGELTSARASLLRAGEAGAQGPVVEALALAVRNEQARRDSQTTPATAPASTSPSPDSPDQAARAQREAREREARDRESAQRESAERARADAEQRALLARAEDDLREGRSAKDTELGRAALSAVKDSLRTRLSVGGAKPELVFPEDSIDKVIVVFREGEYTVRGYVDQWNTGRVPVRLFYLARLKPAAEDRWTLLALELLQ